MADPDPSPSSTMAEPHEPVNQNHNTESHQSNPSPSPSTTTTAPPNSVQETPNSTSLPPSLPLPPPPPAISPYAPPQLQQPVVVAPVAPSFRPVLPPQYTPLPNMQNLGYQVPPPGGAVQPPGVVTSGAGAAVTVSNMMSYQVPPPGQQLQNPAMRPQYMTMPNGYPGMPMPGPQGTVPPPGILRYPSPYAPMVRYPSPRPPGAIGMFPMLPRPPFTGIPGIRPFMPLGVRPAILPIVTPAEKPQTTVYIGKISPTVENDFMLAVLRLCGPVKSWKRPQDSTNGTPKGFGFCEFESAEGVLRVLRLLSKLNIDGQELVLNVNQATREYLERYVEKKTENAKQTKVTEGGHTEKEESSVPSADKNDPSMTSNEESKKENNAPTDKETQDPASFGIVTDEDKVVDLEALEKLTNMIEERIKTRPLPPPPPLPPSLSAGDITGDSKSELPLRDGDSDTDMMRNDASNDKNDEETTSENRAVNDPDKTEAGSPNRSRRRDRSRDRDRDRDRDSKREKDREFEKVEREAQRERERKERERDRKVQEAERAEREYKERVKEWESRERERERQRQTEKEREKERERKRKKEVKDDEVDDDDSRKKLRRSALEEKRRKRLREQDDDLEDKIKEEEEVAEALERAKEEQERREKQQEEDALKLLSANVTHKSEDEIDETQQDDEDASGRANHIGNGILQNGMDVDDDSTLAPASVSDMQQQSSNAPKKLGFGLVGTGKKTSVPSVFTVEEDDGQNDKRMRPLVPIDYSKEELQAVQPSNAATTPPNLAAAAEFAKRLSNANPKEEKPDGERERSRRSHDRSSHRDRDRSVEGNRHRDDNRERNVDHRERDRDRDRDRERGTEKTKTPDKKKLLDAKQLIDMIPKTKDELFSYEINWGVYDKHELHERMRPWISKKITEFLGEEETTLVDYIVSSTQEHVKASQMLELLQSILDDEAEMFVLKMWRMLIFEIKKVESGIASKS